MTQGAVVLTPRLVKIQRRLRGVKKRLVLVAVAFGLGSALTWYFYQDILAVLLLPAGGLLSENGRPIFTAPTDGFSVKVGLTLRGGVVLAIPSFLCFVLWALWPFLRRRHRRFIAVFLPAALVCYGLGTAFAYFVLLPTGLRFLLSFGAEVADPMIRLTDYMALTYAMLFWLGLAFELPLVMFLLVKLRVVPFQRIRRLNRYAIPSLVIFGAVITPGLDPMTSLLVIAPLILLYQLGLGVALLARPKLQTLSNAEGQRTVWRG